MGSKLSKSIPAIVLLLFLFAIFSANTQAANDKTSMDVKSRMSKGENVQVIIVLKNQPSFKTLSKENAVSTLKSHASTSQKALSDLLDEEKGRGKADKIKRFWIVNAIAVNASPELIEELSMRDDVASIELDSELHILEDFSVQVSQGQIDSATSEIKRINATKVWELGIDGSGVNVSVIDTGINALHPDIAGRVIKWVDFVNGNNASAYDDNGHGTHVAGTVGGNGNKGITTGVAPNVSLFGAKVCYSGGSCPDSDIIWGIQWSVENKANIISMSIGGGNFYTSNCDSDYLPLTDAIHNAIAANVTVVVAAGNTDHDGVSSPGCISGTIAVGAVDSTDTIADFSAIGAAMTDHGVVAPGVTITSLNYASSGYVSAGWSGTSMATPHVAGTVALLLHAANRQGTTLTPAQIKNIFNSTSIDLGAAGNDTTFGSGRINVSGAVLSIDTVGPNVIANPTGYIGGNTAAKNGTAITLNATITDAISGVKNASVNVSSINASLTNVSLSNSSGFWTNSSVIVNTPDGTYRLNITAYDNADNKNDTMQIPVIVDNTPPGNITINVSYQRGSAANNGSIMGFNVSADDPLVNSTSSGLRNASVNASPINNTGWITLINYSGFWRGNATFDKFIADDNYSLNVTFFDYAGNKNDSMQINISIDNTPPNVTNLSVTPNSLVVGSNANITANVSDIRLNTSSILVEVKHPKGYTNTSPMNGEGLYYNNYTNTSEYGRYNVTIIASDLVGNINNTVKSWFVTVMPPYVNQSVNTTANNATEIDALNEVNMTLELVTSNDTTSGTINMTMSSDVPPGINRSFASTPLGKYIEVNASGSIKNNLTWIKLKFYYTEAELAASGLDENSLKISWYNESAVPPRWENLAKGSPSWVNDAGVNTANINNYSGYVWANISHFSTFALVGTITSGDGSNPGSSGGGGGGGGGGGPSGENYSNILVKENYDLYIAKDIVTSYAFTNKSNPVEFVNITGNTSAGIINVAVEALKNTSTLVKAPAPGITYKNVNIWVGTTGFAVPKNIKEATILFRVENSWLSSNSLAGGDVKLEKWDGSRWMQLETSEITRDDLYTYFEGKTNSFSPFAITGSKGRGAQAATPAIAGTTAQPAQTPATAATRKAAGFEAIIVIAIFIAIYFRMKRRD